MLPPRLIRRLVLAPLAVVIALALAVLYPLLALLSGIFGLVTRRPGGTGQEPCGCCPSHWSGCSPRALPCSCALACG